MNATKEQMSLFREAIRHLWNTSFRSLEQELRFGSCDEHFAQIKELLFRALVAEPLGLEFTSNKFGKLPISGLRVTPSSENVPVLVNRSTPPTGYWDDPTKVLPGTTELGFLGFFDWDEYGVKDCEYCRCVILSHPLRPDLAGREVLVGFLYLNFDSA
jgi:hypothetical protein